MKIHNIFSHRLDDLSDQELGQLFSDWLNGAKPKIIVTPNPEFLLLARHDKEFAELLSQSDLSLPDGVGLKYAVAALTDQKLEHRHTGVDTLEYLASTGARLALVGGKKEITENEFNNLKSRAYGSTIRDTYLLSENPKITLQIYQGQFKGLIRAEVEFNSIEEADTFIPLSWMGKEITGLDIARDSTIL